MAKKVLRSESRTVNNPRSLLYGYENTARAIQDFLYEGRPGRSKNKTHTAEEYREFLVRLLDRNWKNYNDGLKKLTD